MSGTNDKDTNSLQQNTKRIVTKLTQSAKDEVRHFTNYAETVGIYRLTKQTH